MPRTNLTKLNNRAIRPTIFAIMDNMNIADRSDENKIADLLKKQGYQTPKIATLKKNQMEFLRTRSSVPIATPNLNGNTGLNLDDHISLHDLAELASHKDLIQRIGPEKIAKIAALWG